MKHDYHNRDDGLLHCKVCNGGEGSLPTDCPGRRMTASEEDQVYGGTLDYRAGQWVDATSDPTFPDAPSLVVNGRTEAEWCKEACRIGAYDCVGPDGKHIRTFTGERTEEKIIATIRGLEEQAARYDMEHRVKGDQRD